MEHQHFDDGYRFVIISWTFLLIAGAADILTTIYGLRIGFAEVNPTVNHGIVELGIHMFVVIKVFAIGVFAVATAVLFHMGVRAWICVPLPGAVVWSVMALWNAILIAGFVP